MNRQLQRAGLVIVAAVAMGCGGGSQEPEFGRADVEVINATNAEFAAAYNEHDAEKTASFFSGGAVFMPPNSSTLRGQELIQQFYAMRFEETSNTFELEPGDVGGDGSLAYASGTYVLRPADPAGRRDRGKYLWVLRRLGGRWQYEYQIWSSDLPVPASAPAPPVDPAP